MKTNAEIMNLNRLLVVNIGEDGGMGWLFGLHSNKPIASVIWSTGGGWDHVSISPMKKSHTPSWDEMCDLKDMFFREDEVVMQLHPAKSQYVNNMPNCLHLWKPQYELIPTPPSIMVGIRDGQTMAEAKKEIEAIE